MPTNKPQFAQGRRIEAFATKRFGTQRRLSEALDIRPSQLSIYCSNTQAPGYTPLKLLFDAGLSIDWLMADEDELYLFDMDRMRKDVRPARKRAVEDMTTVELAEELVKRLQQEQTPGTEPADKPQKQRR